MLIGDPVVEIFICEQGVEIYRLALSALDGFRINDQFHYGKILTPVIGEDKTI
jgi:hypothetical protein